MLAAREGRARGGGLRAKPRLACPFREGLRLRGRGAAREPSVRRGRVHGRREDAGRGEAGRRGRGAAHVPARGGGRARARARRARAVRETPGARRAGGRPHPARGGPREGAFHGGAVPSLRARVRLPEETRCLKPLRRGDGGHVHAPHAAAVRAGSRAGSGAAARNVSAATSGSLASVARTRIPSAAIATANRAARPVSSADSRTGRTS